MASIMTRFRMHAMAGRARRRYGVNVGDKERFFSAMAGGALLLYGLGKRGALGAALSTLGGALVARGATGRCEVYRALGVDGIAGQKATGRVGVATTVPGAIRVEASVTFEKPREELYRFFRDFSNFPRFMAEIEQVKVMDAGRSHWVTKGPLGAPVAWDVEIVEDVENERIAWRSLGSGEAMHGGIVHFCGAPGGRGVEVTLILDCEPREGFFGERPTVLECASSELRLRGDLRRCKQLLEAGEIATTVGQPSGRKGE